jgi:hypothetical protein
MSLKNRVQLIVYPDSLGGDLVELHYVLRRYLSRAIGGIHLLPFYPSSADRGFAPLTYDEVDPTFGTWRDIDLIGREFDLTIDFMVNHISRQSIYFQSRWGNQRGGSGQGLHPQTPAAVYHYPSRRRLQGEDLVHLRLRADRPGLGVAHHP